MASMYSNSEYYRMILCVGAAPNNSLNAARELYRQRYIEGRANAPALPAYDCFRRLASRLSDTGSFHASNTRIEGRSSGRREAEIEESILEYFEDHPNASTRKAAAALGISKTKVWRISKRDFKHPYRRYSIVQELTLSDYPRRLQFCQWYQTVSSGRPVIDNILWTDEASFTSCGFSNYHNEHVWTFNNPYTSQKNKENRSSINVWAGIVGNKLLGPVFLPGNLNGDKYMTFLRTTLEDLLEDLPVNIYQNLIFQHSGTPAHYSSSVCQYVSNRFKMWIGKGGSVEWPPRSPDLSPMDFFLWHYIRNIVYEEESLTVQEIKNKITIAFSTVTTGMLNNIGQSLIRRTQLCFDRNGQHIEPFL